MEGQTRHVGDLEEQVRAEGDAGAVVPAPDGGVRPRAVADPPQGDPPGARRAAPVGEVPLLVELAIGGQVGFRGDAAHGPALDDDGAVVQAASLPQGRADDDRREEPGGGRADGLDTGEGLVEQHVAEQQVVDGVAGQAELGEGGQAHAVVGQGAGPLDDRRRVGGGVRQRDRQCDGGHARESLVVGGAELDGRLLGGGRRRGCVLMHVAILPRASERGALRAPEGPRTPDVTVPLPPGRNRDQFVTMDPRNHAEFSWAGSGFPSPDPL